MPDLKSPPAALVGGKEISLHEVLYTLKLKGQLGAIVAQAVTDRLIADAAASEGVNVTEAELQKAADGFRLKSGLNRADATERWLQEHQLNREDMEAGLHRALLQQKMTEKIASPERVEQHFLQTRARFDQARLAQIVVPREGVARELLSQIQEENKDFGELARQHSSDPRSKAAGGKMGVLPRQRLTPAVASAVFAAKPGDVVGPFQLGKAWHLIKVEELLPGQLTSDLRPMLRREMFERWLSEQAQATGVQVKLHEFV